MFTYLIAGATLGLWAGVSPGPLLAVVITQTLRHGPGEGAKVAMAPILTDLPIIALFLFLVAQVPQLELFLGVVSLLGGGLVAWLAVGAIRQGPVELDLAVRAPRSLLKGALVNVMSPHPYLFWFTIGVPTIYKASETSVDAAVAFAAAFFVLIIGAKVCVALLVARSRTFLRGAVYIWSMRIIGLAMLAFAVLLVMAGVEYLTLATA